VYDTLYVPLLEHCLCDVVGRWHRSAAGSCEAAFFDFSSKKGRPEVEVLLQPSFWRGAKLPPPARARENPQATCRDWLIVRRDVFGSSHMPGNVRRAHDASASPQAILLR